MWYSFIYLLLRINYWLILVVGAVDESSRNYFTGQEVQRAWFYFRIFPNCAGKKNTNNRPGKKLETWSMSAVADLALGPWRRIQCRKQKSYVTKLSEVRKLTEYVLTGQGGQSLSAGIRTKKETRAIWCMTK